jgi:hypothetical protein
VNPNTLAVTNLPILGADYLEVGALTHFSGNVMLLTDIDLKLYKITTTGVVTFVGDMDHAAKGLAVVTKPPDDFDADGKNDIGNYRNGIWYVIRSSDGGVTVTEWGGLAQDMPVPAGYDGDGKTDIAVYRGGGGSFSDLRTMESQPWVGETPRTHRCRRTMMGMARQILRCTEMACGLSSFLQMGYRPYWVGVGWPKTNR